MMGYTVTLMEIQHRWLWLWQKLWVQELVWIPAWGWGKNAWYVKVSLCALVLKVAITTNCNIQCFWKENTGVLMFCVSLVCLWARTTGRRPWCRTCDTDYICQLAWEHPGIPVEELKGSAAVCKDVCLWLPHVTSQLLKYLHTLLF